MKKVDVTSRTCLLTAATFPAERYRHRVLREGLQLLQP
jgi:hypothetical protein